MTPVNIDTIPDKCLEKILQFVVEQPDHGLNVTLVCKKWYPIGLPLVYRDTIMHPHNANKVLKALEDGKEKGIGNLVKNVICVSAGMGSGVGVEQLGALLSLAPQVQDLFIARFWHQWLHNMISISPTMSNIRILALHFDYSPLPNPDPSEFIGQFSNWPSLEKLTIRMLSFMDFSRMTASVELDASHDSTIVPHPESQLKKLVIVGNMIPPQAMTAGLSALRAPLEVLHFSSIAMFGPQGVVGSLRLVGKHLKALEIYNDGRMSAMGSFSDVLFPRLKSLAPSLQRLDTSRIDFPEQCFSMLPSTLRELRIAGDTLLSAPQVWQGLEKQMERLNCLKVVEWQSMKDNKEGWGEEEVVEFCAWGTSRSISIVARHISDEDI